MSLPPSPPELVEADEGRAPPGFGIVLALGMSAPFWMIVLLVAVLWR